MNSSLSSWVNAEPLLKDGVLRRALPESAQSCDPEVLRGRFENLLGFDLSAILKMR